MSPQEQIVQTLEKLHEGRLVEIRAMFARGTRTEIWSGYYFDYAAAAKDAYFAEQQGAEGVYMLLNVIHPGLVNRSPNQMSQSPRQTTADKDVLARRWMLVDVDPVRPSGISSTDAELAAARAVRDRVYQFCYRTMPMIDMHKACSGNGAHLLIEIEGLEGADPKRWLESLQAYYGNERCHIDVSTHSLAQLTKLYGTLARKGHEGFGRFHRRSFLEC